MKKNSISKAGQNVSERLQELEKTIATAFINAFMAIGLALTEIRDTKLYKVEFDRFADYCSTRWQLSKSQAFRFIKAAKIYQILERGNTNGKYPMPIAESQIRPFEGLESEEEICNAWAKSCEIAGGKVPTANIVYRVIASSAYNSQNTEKDSEETEDTQNNKITLPFLHKIKKKYNVLLADLPWDYEYGFKKSIYPGNQYPLLSLTEMGDLGIQDICQENCAGFFWVPSPKCAEAHILLQQLGFTYKTLITWIKDTDNGIGRWVRSAPEHLFIATKGRPGIPDFSDTPAGYYCSEPEGHSVKPAIFHEIIEELTKGLSDRIELFSRRTGRKGWDYWGNEVGYVTTSPSGKVSKWGEKKNTPKTLKKAA